MKKVQLLLTLLLSFSYAVVQSQQARLVEFDWAEKRYGTLINCGGDIGTSSKSKVVSKSGNSGITYNYQADMRVAGVPSVKYWTDSRIFAKCNQNKSAERSETAFNKDQYGKKWGVQPGTTVYFGYSVKYPKIDWDHTTTIFQFRSNCSPGSPQTKMNMLPGGQVILKVRQPNKTQKVIKLKEGVWYDVVIQVHYSFDKGLFKVWFVEAGDDIDYAKPTALVNVNGDGTAPTLQPGDKCPHIRWGLYRHQSGDKHPDDIDYPLMEKLVSRASLYLTGQHKDREEDWRKVIQPWFNTQIPPVKNPEDPEEEPIETGEEAEPVTEVDSAGYYNVAKGALAFASTLYGASKAEYLNDGKGLQGADNPHGNDADLVHTVSKTDPAPAVGLILDSLSYVQDVVIYNRRSPLGWINKRLEGAKVYINDTVLIGNLGYDHIQSLEVATEVKRIWISHDPGETIHVGEMQLWTPDDLESDEDTVVVDPPLPDSLEVSYLRVDTLQIITTLEPDGFELLDMSLDSLSLGADGIRIKKIDSNLKLEGLIKVPLPKYKAKEERVLIEGKPIEIE